MTFGCYFQIAFKNILLPFCECFSMIYNIKKFGTELYSVYNQGSEQSPPLTYEAYNAALKQHLYELKNKVINIEKDVMNQGKLTSFIYL